MVRPSASFVLVVLALASGCSGDADGKPSATGGAGGSAGTASAGTTSAGTTSAGNANAGAPNGGSAGMMMSDAPAGLEQLPPAQSCDGERCSFQCLTPETPKNEYCELVVTQYAPSGMFLAADGMLYVGHLDGLGKVDPAGGTALTPVTTDMTQYVGPVLVDGTTAYFARNLASAGLWRVPTAGGPAEELAPMLVVEEMAFSAKGLLLTTGPLGLQFTEWDGAMATDVGDFYDRTFLGDGFAYWNQFPEGMFKAPIDDLASAERVGETTLGDFVVQGGNVYAIGSQLSDLYFHGPDGSVDEKLWGEGEGRWSGDVNHIRVYPGHDDAVFFRFQTETLDYLMRWNIGSKTASHLGNLAKGCFSNYLIAGDYAYLGGCQAVYRVKLP